MGDSGEATAPPSWQQTFDYYNPLHFRNRKPRPTTAPVYSRDFAYTDGPQVLAHAMRIEPAQVNALTSAKNFAEYVHLSFAMHGAFPGHAEPVAPVVDKRACMPWVR
jgi:hypothetical protein